MSEASAPSPETPGKPPAESAPRARRVSKPRPRKTAKSAPKPDAEESPEPAEKAAPYPVFDDAPSAKPEPAAAKTPPASESEASPAPGDDWPESDSGMTGAPAPSEHPKRKRRRKKGKGGGAQNAAGAVDAEFPPQGVAEGDADSAPHQGGQQKRPNQAPRVRIDNDLLAKFAWKIYLAEVSEEGVALVGDGDARELARRCFRLAELFLEEQGRRRSVPQ